MRETIVIAGATGFVGHAVASKLAERFDVVGLTRGRTDAKGAWDRLVACDLFSLKDVERALQGATHVVYLVHSMLPSARLVQGNFADPAVLRHRRAARAHVGARAPRVSHHAERRPAAHRDPRLRAASAVADLPVDAGGVPPLGDGAVRSPPRPDLGPPARSRSARELAEHDPRGSGQDLRQQRSLSWLRQTLDANRTVAVDRHQHRRRQSLLDYSGATVKT